jgi:hypothetical protein
MVKGLQEQDIQGAVSIDEDSVELDVLDNGLTMTGYYPSFGTKPRWSLHSKVMGISDHLRYSRVVGETAMTSRAVSFCFLLDSYESKKSLLGSSGFVS